ncbi:MAG: hypothetical protein V8T87_10105 [Victivallales bacterium]
MSTTARTDFSGCRNGSEIWLIGLDDAERADKVLGKEFCTLYFNECSELDYSSIETALSRNAQELPGDRKQSHLRLQPAGEIPLDVSRIHSETHAGRQNRAEASGGLRIHDYQSNRQHRKNLPPGYIENTLANMSKRKRERFLEREIPGRHGGGALDGRHDLQQTPGSPIRRNWRGS